ncbi:phospholipase-like protein [Tanacetum coccineum]
MASTTTPPPPSLFNRPIFISVGPFIINVPCLYYYTSSNVVWTSPTGQDGLVQADGASVKKAQQSSQPAQKIVPCNEIEEVELEAYGMDHAPECGIGCFTNFFGRKEFCLMTSFRFGKVSEKYSKSSPFCQRLFPEKVTKKGVLNLKSIELLGVLRHTETWIGLSDMDAVRVCLLLVAELVFMGKEDMNCIPRNLVSLVEDFDCWNDYPWGEYMWVKFYNRTVNVAADHKAFHLDKKKQNPDYYLTYNLYGFPLAFKLISLNESFLDMDFRELSKQQKMVVEEG